MYNNFNYVMCYILIDKNKQDTRDVDKKCVFVQFVPEPPQ